MNIAIKVPLKNSEIDDMASYYEKIDRILKQIEDFISNKGPAPLNEEQFTILAGIYSKELKNLLSLYHNSKKKEEKQEIAPFLNYYKQIQHYLVFILRFPTILQVPGHSEILQLLDLIQHKEELIETKYREISRIQFSLFEKPFRERLESELRAGPKWMGKKNSQNHMKEEKNPDYIGSN